ncbi:hypothetical protein GUITHDRAFT_110652 [Guillardia theta CCMP2712]|uniref:Uncharacterized protein n=1 Tax=Guillardia theta (strain CCMP2712) TaxID=905079 RepID=L1J575_GUITC|nr:hypothetical protein GUITHDRAFT_110652 [Guillardia theta CCMP2712]EKX43235.1 hypothetical protein GUITHDRAFT_110652 [Guillardia theta CCMP2712]|eukprot:XP_005830215.1 hypothetical protein GUITHDRAFT_110652 [Guillardia theta CCMP2712]
MVEKDLLVIHGGENDDVAMSDTWAGKISEEAVSWTRIAKSRELHARQGHVAAAHEGKCFIFGGVDMMKTFDELHVLDLRSSEEWMTPRTSGRRPTARGNHGLAVREDMLYVYGGFDGIQHLNDMYMLDLRSMTWQLLLPHAADRQPYPLSQHVLLPWDDKLISFGGMSSANHESDAPVSAIDFFSCSDHSPSILVVGGWTADHPHPEIASEAFWYSLEDKSLTSSTWSKGTDKEVFSRVGMSLNSFGRGREDECFMFGGWDGFFNRYNDLYRVNRE